MAALMTKISSSLSSLGVSWNCDGRGGSGSLPRRPVWGQCCRRSRESRARFESGHPFPQPAELLPQSLEGVDHRGQVHWFRFHFRLPIHSGIRPCFFGGR